MVEQVSKVYVQQNYTVLEQTQMVLSEKPQSEVSSKVAEVISASQLKNGVNHKYLLNRFLWYGRQLTQC